MGTVFLQTHQTGSVIVEKKVSRFRYKLIQSVEHFDQQSREGYKQRSVYFPAGIAVDRSRNDISWLLDVTSSYEIPDNISGLTNKVDFALQIFKQPVGD